MCWRVEVRAAGLACWPESGCEGQRKGGWAKGRMGERAGGWKGWRAGGRTDGRAGGLFDDVRDARSLPGGGPVMADRRGTVGRCDQNIEISKVATRISVFLK